MTTQCADWTCVVVGVGLGAEAVEVLTTALGDTYKLVVTQEADAATDLVAILRPRLVVATSPLPASDTSLLEAAAATYGAEVICLRASATGRVLASLLQRVAAIAFVLQASRCAARPLDPQPSTNEHP